MLVAGLATCCSRTTGPASGSRLRGSRRQGRCRCARLAGLPPAAACAHPRRGPGRVRALARRGRAQASVRMLLRLDRRRIRAAARGPQGAYAHVRIDGGRRWPKRWANRPADPLGRRGTSVVWPATRLRAASAPASSRPGGGSRPARSVETSAVGTSRGRRPIGSPGRTGGVERGARRARIRVARLDAGAGVSPASRPAARTEVGTVVRASRVAALIALVFPSLPGGAVPATGWRAAARVTGAPPADAPIRQRFRQRCRGLSAAGSPVAASVSPHSTGPSKSAGLRGGPGRSASASRGRNRACHWA